MARPMRRRSRVRRGIVDITLTPLIDTALTLLVIFMITAPMMRNAINIQLPKGQAREVTDEHPRMTVQVNGKGEYFFDGKQVGTRNELIAMIKKEAARTKATMVVVEGDEQVGYGTVFELIDQIKVVGGIDYVAMSSRRT